MKVFVTDGDNRAALAITRSLGARGHEVVVGEKRTPALAQTSRFCASRIHYPDPAARSDEFVDYLAKVVHDHAIDVLLPVADITTFLVTDNVERFGPSCRVPFASAETVQRAANKVEVFEAAVRLGLPVPGSLLVCDPDRIPPDLRFPLVVKPRQSRVRTAHGWISTTVSYAKDAAELQRNLASRGRHEFPVMLQEQIVGPGVGVFACYHQGRPTALFSHRRVRERPPWGGVSVLSESTELDPLAREYAIKLLDDLGWHGVAMVEFKRDVRDGLPKLMEINGRFWGSLQLAVDAGVDFPALLVEGGPPDGLAAQPPYRVGVKNRWFWGDVDSLLLTFFRGNRTPTVPMESRWRAALEFAKLWSPTMYYENPKAGDLGPWVFESLSWFRRAAGRRRPKASRVESGRSAPRPPGVATGKAPAASVLDLASTRPAGQLRAHLVDSIEQLGLDENGWAALAAESDTDSVFQTLPWTRTWWSVFRDRYEPLFVSVTRDDRVVGVAPMVLERRGRRDRIVRFLGDGRADYCDFLTATDKEPVMAAILDTIFAHRDWDVLELNNVPGHSRTVDMVRDRADRAGYRSLVAGEYVCPTLVVSASPDSARRIFDKPSLRRPTNYFRRAGRLACHDLTTASEIAPYLDAFFTQHIGRWRSTNSQSLFLSEQNRIFYRELTANLSDSGALLFSVATLNDQPIAFHYGFDYRGGMIWYKPSFDSAHAAHSPGLVMVRHLIGRAIACNRRELDFTVGDEPFKKRISNASRHTTKLLVYRNPARFMMGASKRRSVSVMKRWLGGRGDEGMAVS
jgi:predicted ATP-grasp superfamily ATP-dependent carboligase/CelD/BcsL family acetyltransferase involved in cellulose biosynthesis